MILANNRSTKLGTLICSAHARTVRAQFWFEHHACVAGTVVLVGALASYY
jgi:hypothetical protein